MQDQIARLYRRVQLLVGIGRTTAAAQDDGVIQTQQVRLRPDGAIRDGSRVLSMFGFSSSAPIGSDVVVLFLAGDRSKGVVIGTANQAGRFRNLVAGETAIHNIQGMSVHLSAEGIVVNGGGMPVTIMNASKLRAECPIESTGEITANADTAPKHVSTHRHIASGGGGTTSIPDAS